MSLILDVNLGFKLRKTDVSIEKFRTSLPKIPREVILMPVQTGA